jgi:hypothetical protein
MALIALLIGVVLIIVAVRNSQDDLFNALGQDVPKFVVWAAAIAAIGAIGYVPGLKPTSKLLLGLIILVIIINNYNQIANGFTMAWTNPGPSGTTGAAASGSTPSSANGSGSPQASTGGLQSWESIASQFASTPSE